MRILLLLCCTMAFICVAGQRVDREQTEKEFLSVLQTALEIGIQQINPEEPSCTIDSAFSIDDKGVLSLTLRYQKKDSSFYLQRYAVPLYLISNVFYDIYIGLECYNDAVYIRRSKKNTSYYNQYAETRLWHIGMLPETKGQELQQKLTALVRELRNWYH
jgi:hypothetical protein